jgi:hypothetical protein
VNPWIQLVYPSQVPPENVLVETKIDGDEFGERGFCILKRRGKLWFVPDGTMHVYYEPSHWRDIKGGAA